MTTYYKAGSWNAICDVCGVQYKADQLKKRWDGVMVCNKDYETRHPQTLLKVRNETNNVPYVRRMDDVYINAPFCSLAARVSIPGYALPGCSVPHLLGPLGF